VTDEEGHRLSPIQMPFPFPPYFFALKEALSGVPLSGAPVEGTTYNGKPVVRVEADSPKQVYDLRQAIGVKNTLEADIPYARRVMLDRGLSVDVPKRYIHVDVEVDPREGMPDETKAEQRILSIAAVTNTGEEYYFSEQDERVLLAKFLLFLDQFPVYCTFNGNHFDVPYLMNRCKKLGINYWWDAHVHIDLLAVYKFVLQKRQDRYDLSHLCKVEGLTAQKREVDISKLHWYFENEPETLREYNMGDVRPLRELDQKLQMVTIVFNIAKVSHTLPKDLLRVHEKSHKEYNTSVAVDGLILYLARRRSPRILYPTREYKEVPKDKKEKKYAGALVLEPVPGVHKNVIALDVASMYPTIIGAFNMGPETFIPERGGDSGFQTPGVPGKAPEGREMVGSPGTASDSSLIRSPIGRGYFKREPKSVFAEALELVLKIRQEYKKRMRRLDPSTQEWKDAFSMDYAHKVLANSFYGVLGSTFSRYYSKDLAENITLTGQLVTRFLRDTLEEKGHTVVGGDTDSVMFTTDDLNIDAAQKLASELTTRCSDYLWRLSGARPDLFRLDVAQLCKAMYFPKSAKGGVKKRYAGLVIWEGKPVFYYMLKGFEYVRHDSSEAQKKMQHQAILLLLSGASEGAKRKFVESWWEQLKNGGLDDKLVRSKSFGKAPDEYKTERVVVTEEDGKQVETRYKVTPPPFVRLAKRLEAEGKMVLHKGDRVTYLKYGKELGDLVEWPFPEGFKLTESNYRYIWTSQFVPLLRRAGFPVKGIIGKK
jgi:DNA polymerase I